MSHKSSFVSIEPEALRPDDAMAFVGLKRDAFQRCRNQGWITPCVSQPKLVLYRPSALRILLNRLEREGLPPSKSKNAIYENQET